MPKCVKEINRATFLKRCSKQSNTSAFGMWFPNNCRMSSDNHPVCPPPARYFRLLSCVCPITCRALRLPPAFKELSTSYHAVIKLCSYESLGLMSVGSQPQKSSVEWARSHRLTLERLHTLTWDYALQTGTSAILPEGSPCPKESTHIVLSPYPCNLQM